MIIGVRYTYMYTIEAQKEGLKIDRHFKKAGSKTSKKHYKNGQRY